MLTRVKNKVKSYFSRYKILRNRMDAITKSNIKLGIELNDIRNEISDIKKVYVVHHDLFDEIKDSVSKELTILGKEIYRVDDLRKLGQKYAITKIKKISKEIKVVGEIKDYIKETHKRQKEIFNWYEDTEIEIKVALDDIRICQSRMTELFAIEERINNKYKDLIKEFRKEVNKIYDEANSVHGMIRRLAYVEGELVLMKQHKEQSHGSGSQASKSARKDKD